MLNSESLLTKSSNKVRSSKNDLRTSNSDILAVFVTHQTSEGSDNLAVLL